MFEDTEATVGADESREQTEAFFRGPLRALIEHVDAPTLVAIQSHLIEGSAAFARLGPSLERVAIPLLDAQASSVVTTILTRRLSHAGIAQSAGEIFAGDAIEALAGVYRQSSGNLRHLLAVAHDATDRAAMDRATLVELAHVRFGLAQWT